MILICSLVFSNLYAKQPITNHEKKLIDIYQKLRDASTKLNNPDNSDHFQLEELRDQISERFFLYLLDILKNDTNAINYKFERLIKYSQVAIITSKDKRIRFYSWNTMTGGSMDQIAIIAQYKGANNKIYCRIINSAGFFYKSDMFVNGPNIIVSQVITVDSKKHQYIVLGEGKCETNCVSKYLNLYTILDTYLEDTDELIPFKGKPTNQLHFQYKLYNLKVQGEPEFIVDLRKGSIAMPIIDYEKEITRKEYETWYIGSVMANLKQN